MVKRIAIRFVMLAALGSIHWPTSGLCTGKDPLFKATDQIQPVEGAEKVDPKRPDWCEGYTDKWANFSNPVLTIQGIVSQGYNLALLRKIGWAACDDPDNPLRQQWVASWRQGFVNEVGWSEAEDREAMKIWTLEPREFKAKHEQLCQSLQPDASALPPELEKAWAKFTTLQCGQKSNREALEYWLDRSTEVDSELVRVNLVMDCFGNLVQNGSSSNCMGNG